MSKYIVTTTIYEPSKALLLFLNMKDWQLIVVGDMKTPHNRYYELQKSHSNFQYLNPEFQEKKYPAVSQSIGWNNIQRRNIGFLEAYAQGAEIIATVDDDNIPLINWGKNISIGKTMQVECFEPMTEVFDPLSITNDNFVWHRGFPIQLLQQRHKYVSRGKISRKVLVQADLWNGDPDIDAMARITYRPLVNYDSIIKPYCSNKIAPFNSQNTFISREALPYYAVLPHVGRMDDIWGGYILQHYFPDSVIYAPASVYQDRNEQDLITNLENEILGYRTTYNLVRDLANYLNYLPKETQRFWEVYQSAYQEIKT